MCYIAYRYAFVAQSVEQGTENPCVRGSIPREGTKTQFVVEIPPQNILYLVVEFRICFDENVDENFSQEGHENNKKSSFYWAFLLSK